MKPALRRAASVLPFVLALSLPAAAQSVKPGLWELTNQVNSENPELNAAMALVKEQMANMSPEQRKMMGDMLSKNGMSMNLNGPPGSVQVQHCMTKEMAERADLPLQQDGNCKSTKSPISGGKMSFTFSCTNPASSGQGQVVFAGTDRYTADIAVTTSARGTPEKLKVQTSARWIGSDCTAMKK